MIKATMLSAVSLLLLSAILLPFNAAAQTVRECVQQANQEGAACKANCEQTRKDQVLNCRVPQGDCGDACKAAYQACIVPFETERETCLDTCDTEFQNERVGCAAQCSCTLEGDCGNNACFGACVFGPAVDRAVCRVACWRDSTVKNGFGRELSRTESDVPFEQPSA